jgi:uncharacterized protein with PQ loop repeat
MLTATTMLTAVMPVLLVVANVFGAGMILPQVLRLRLTRTLDGISATWVGVGIAMNLWWIAYALPNELWGLLPVSSIAALLYLVMAHHVVMIAGRSGLRPLMIGLCLFGSVPLIALVVGGLPGAGLAIGLSYGAQFAPAAATAVRAAGTAGISATTWTMGLIEALIWLLYGVTLGDWALVIGGGGSTLMAAVIVIRLALDTSRRDHRIRGALVHSA